jgi:hypothetical protein
MSEQDALRFLQDIREAPSLREAIVARQAELTLDDLVVLGASRDHRFTRADLEQAFRHDWTMRLMHARRRTAE